MKPLSSRARPVSRNQLGAAASVVTKTASAESDLPLSSITALAVTSRARACSCSAMPRAARTRRKVSRTRVLWVARISPSVTSVNENASVLVPASRASVSKRVRKDSSSSTPPAPPPIATIRRGPSGRRHFSNNVLILLRTTRSA